MATSTSTPAPTAATAADSRTGKPPGYVAAPARL